MFCGAKIRKRQSVIGCLFDFFKLIFFIGAFCIISKAEQLPVKTYTVADGLLRDIVYRIRQDSRGFLWFCTTEGISRFDGAGITNFTTADGLPHRFINDFLETSGGTIYIATGKGLARLNPHGLRGSTENPLFTVILPENERAENIKILFEDKNKQVWIGTSDGLYKLIQNKEQTVLVNVPLGEPLKSSGGAIAAPSPNTLSVSAILEDSRGTFWIATYGGGLFRLATDGSIRRFTGEDALQDNKITDLLETSDGQLLMSLRSDEKGGLCLLDAETSENPVKKCWTTANGLGSNWIRDILQTSDGQIWLATLPGLCRFQPENSTSVCKTFSAKNDLCEDVVALAEDKDGNLWTGSPCGTKKIARYGFTTYRVPNDAPEGFHVNSIFEDKQGELFISTFRAENVIGRFDGNEFSLVKPRFPAFVDYHGWGWQQTVWHDSRGAWWIPTGKGLFRSPDNTSFERLADAPLKKVETGAKGEEVFRLFEDSRGDIWIFTIGFANELLRWERAKNVWHDYTQKVGFSGYRVGSAFTEDSHGNIWIGATSDHNNSALIRYRNGEFHVFSRTDGAPSAWIQDLFIDSRGRLWIASDTDGVWRLDDTNSDNFEFIKYTTANGLTSNSTASVAEDRYGRIYIGTWRGIDRLTPETGQIENFTTADGLPSGFVQSAYHDRQNNLWFATDRGLTRFVPEPVRTRKPPNILITALRVNGEAQSISILGETEIPTLDLQSDQRQISVDFLGLGASLGEKLKYEYRFGDADWTETTERTLNFANLTADDYRLEIRAQTADRIYSQTPASISFRIAVPVWQRWWFILLVGVLIGLVIYIFYQNRLKRMLEIERTRTRIATDLHDDIGSNLTKISIMSEVARRIEGEKQQEVLGSIADISRVSVSSMSDIVWAINPKKDSFLELVRRMRSFAETTLEQADISLEFNAPDVSNDLNLDADVRRNVYLIFKESLNNIVRHSQAKKVEIDFTVLHNKLILTVADNGKGFELNGDSDGNGLPNMKRRAADLQGKLEVVSFPGKGARVVLEVPK